MEICLMTQVETVLHSSLDSTIRTKWIVVTTNTSLIEFKRGPTTVVRTSSDTQILTSNSA